jgi:branched-subunit amino acid transport protein
MIERFIRRWEVVVGDVASISIIILYGRVVSHDYPLASLGTIETLSPFLAGWAIGVGLVGLYSERIPHTRTDTLRFVTAAWFVAVAIGLIVRSSPTMTGSVTWPFGLVVAASVLLVLLAWRLTVRVLTDGGYPTTGGG